MCTFPFLIYTVIKLQIANGVACNGASDQLGLRQHKKVWMYYAVLLMLISFHASFLIQVLDYLENTSASFQLLSEKVYIIYYAGINYIFP